MQAIQVTRLSDTATIPTDRIAQLVIQPIVPARLMAVGQLGDTHRGDGGWGSTG